MLDFRTEHCPHCEKHLIEDEVGVYALDDDLEDEINNVCGEATLCSGCRADELSDFNRM